MTVRTHVPWPIRAVRFGLLMVVAVAIALWIYHAGTRFAGFGRDQSEEVSRLRESVDALTKERDRLMADSNAAESRLNIERAAQDQLAHQIKTLELENAKLKDDIGFFESLSASGPVSGISIKRLQVEPDTVPAQMRYRMLVIQGGSAQRDFSGELQLILTLSQNGKTLVLNLPTGPSGSGMPAASSAPQPNPAVNSSNPFHVGFRFYERLEGTFGIPSGAVLKQVEARILEHGATRAQQTIMVN